MKDLFFHEVRLSLRAGGRLGMALVLFFAIALFVPLGIGPDISTHRLIAPGVLWVGALLSSLLTIDNLLARDHEDGTLERLLPAPVPGEGIILSKIMAHWILVCAPLCLAAPVAGLLMNLEFTSGLYAAATLAAGTPAISAISAFAASLTLGMNRGHLIQAALVIPACIPTLIFGSVAAGEMAGGQFPEQALAALAAISLAALAASPFASSALLRLNLRR